MIAYVSETDPWPPGGTAPEPGPMPPGLLFGGEASPPFPSSKNVHEPEPWPTEPIRLSDGPDPWSSGKPSGFEQGPIPPGFRCEIKPGDPTGCDVGPGPQLSGEILPPNPTVPMYLDIKPGDPTGFGSVPETIVPSDPNLLDGQNPPEPLLWIVGDVQPPGPSSPKRYSTEPPKPLSFGTTPPDPLLFEQSPPGPMALLTDQPGLLVLGTTPPDPLLFEQNPPGPMEVGTYPPDPLTFETNLPGPMALATDPPDPLVFGTTPPEPLVLEQYPVDPQVYRAEQIPPGSQIPPDPLSFVLH